MVSTLVLKALALFVGLLTWRQAQRLGAALGLIWFHLVRVRRKVVFSNLSMALPKIEAEHETIALKAYRHFGISALELLRLKGMKSNKIKQLVYPMGMEHYDALRADGKGIVVVTAHFGNFDLLACSQAALGIPLAIVSRELHQNGISRFWMETRTASGLKIFPDRGGAKKVLKWLRAGNVLGLTVDQRTSQEKGGIKCSFLGREAWTTTAPAELALRTGAAILPVRIERRPDGEHNVIVEPRINADGKPDAENIRAVTQRINEVIGNWVQGRPEHWMWLHRRFVV